jgi:hypothetical protein
MGKSGLRLRNSQKRNKYWDFRCSGLCSRIQSGSISEILYAAVLKHKEPTKVHGPVGQHVVVKALLVRHCQTGSAFELYTLMVKLAIFLLSCSADRDKNNSVEK